MKLYVLCATTLLVLRYTKSQDNNVYLQVPNNTEPRTRDSYLDAYIESHNSEADKRKSNSHHHGDEYNGRDPFDDQVDGPYPVSHASYPQEPLPQTAYGIPQHQYGPPQHQYGPPHPVYYPPQNSYGIPVLPHSFEIPFGLWSLIDKFKLKLDILTILKLLLKLVLFKKFVSFVGIICLLLFIPWIAAKKAHHHQHHDDEDEERNIMRKVSGSSLLSNVETIDKLHHLVIKGIQEFSKNSASTIR